jgi:hypothetical protein
VTAAIVIALVVAYATFVLLVSKSIDDGDDQ